jgi:hypothetical protein
MILKYPRVIVVVEVSGYPIAISVVVTVAYETEKDVSVVSSGYDVSLHDISSLAL